MEKSKYGKGFFCGGEGMMGFFINVIFEKKI